MCVALLLFLYSLFLFVMYFEQFPGLVADAEDSQNMT